MPEVHWDERAAATALPGDALGEIGRQFTALVDRLVAVGNRALGIGARPGGGPPVSQERPVEPDFGAVVADNISALSASMRPVDVLSAAGLGQLAGLVMPLQAVLDRMAGNASDVYAFLDAWVSVSERITHAQARYAAPDDADQPIAEFAAAAREAAAVVQLTAEVVGQSRSAANDLITDMVQRLISLVRHLITVEGGMTATVLAQASDLVDTFATPVASIERQARVSLANAVKPINDLIAVMTTVGGALDGLAADLLVPVPHQPDEH